MLTLDIKSQMFYLFFSRHQVLREWAETLELRNQSYACGFPSLLFSFGFLTTHYLTCWTELLGSTDFVEKGTESVVFRTCDQEKDKVVFQIGTSDAVRALTAAQLV
jgi:tRNA-dihydrouridine synthase